MLEYSHNHPHQLELKLYQKPYVCNGCREPGFGPRYSCDVCDYSLHRDCMIPLSSPTSHQFFKNTTFRFFKTPQTKCSCPSAIRGSCPSAIRGCDACGKSINGFSYHCQEKGWDLHPCCKNLEPELSIDGVRFQLLDKVREKCLWCGEKKIRDSVSGIRGWSYVSKCKKYNLHVFCVTEMVSDAFKKMGRNENEDENENENQRLCLEKIELPICPRYVRKRSSNIYCKIAKVLFNTIISVLLGNPTMAISLIIDLLS